MGTINVVLQTKQSLASSDSRLVFKNHSDANSGKHGIAFLKTFYTMFTRKKFGDRNEDDRFQAMASSTSLYNVRR
jgi:hypothetical protein